MARQGLVITGRASEVVPLDNVPGQGLWASRGYDLYFLADGDDTLRRRGRLPVGLEPTSV